MSYNLKEGGINGQTSAISKKKLSDNWQSRLSSMTKDDCMQMTQGIRDWWNTLSDNELKKWKDNVSNGMKKHYEDPNERKCMSDIQKDVWNDKKLRQKLSKKLSGKNNPMFGEKLKDHMSKAAYAKMRNKTRNAMKNRIWIHKGKIRKFIKKDELQTYLNIGWKIGQK